MKDSDDWNHPVIRSDDTGVETDTDGTTLPPMTCNLPFSPEDVAAGAVGNVIQFGKPNKTTPIDDGQWVNTVTMLEDIIADVKKGGTDPVGGLVILYDNDRKQNADKIKLWARGLSRMELLGLVTEIVRSLP